MGYCKFLRSAYCRSLSDRRFLCSVSTNAEITAMEAFKKQPFVEFDSNIEKRMDEAKRSVIVQVKSENTYANLTAYCQDFGKLVDAFHYVLSNNQHFILLEFSERSSVAELMKKCTHLGGGNGVLPVRSPFIWFRGEGAKTSKISPDAPPLRNELVKDPDAAVILGDLKAAKTFSQQAINLYNRTKLNELGIRVRFMSSLQIESSLIGLFPAVKVYPFGSSINGFGKIGCDLDLVAQLDCTDESATKDSRLIFHSKSASSTNFNKDRNHMRTISDILRYILPGCGNIREILQAKVPIIRYRQDFAGLECDLSMNNKSAVYMSEMLYLYANMDWRVAPLTYAIRFWAKEINLTNPAPGRWITNFTLTLLVIFFLQSKNILPSLDALIKNARPQDKREEKEFSFLRDINEIRSEQLGRCDTLFSLLFEFYDYYATFDFSAFAISLNTGAVIPKPEYSAIYVVNPLEKCYNVSRNISPEECQRLKMEFRNAAWVLESSLHEPQKGVEHWGLLHLIQNHVSKVGMRRDSSMRNSTRRLMSVKELFNEECIDISNDGNVSGVNDGSSFDRVIAS